LEFEEDSK